MAACADPGPFTEAADDSDDGFIEVKRKRARHGPMDDPGENSPGKQEKPTLDQESMPHPTFDTISLAGTTLKCSFNFDRRYRPRIISILKGQAKSKELTNFDKSDKKKSLFDCPPKIAGLWMEAMFRKAEEVAKRCRALCSECRLSDKLYGCNSYHLEFHIGQWMTSPTWHSHIILPLHAYFLYRWNYFLTWKSSGESEGKIPTDGERWSTYVDNHRQILDYLRHKFKEYQDKDAASIADTLKSMDEQERIKCFAGGKEPCKDAKDKARPLEDTLGKLPVPLNTNTETTLQECRILYKFDPRSEGIPVVELNFRDVTRFDTSTAPELANVASAVKEFCNKLRFADLQVFVFQEKTINLFVDVCSFLPHLSLSDAQEWKKRWDTICAKGHLPAARAMQADLSKLNKEEPCIRRRSGRFN